MASLYWGLGVVVGEHSVEPQQDFTVGELGVIEFLHVSLGMHHSSASGTLLQLGRHQTSSADKAVAQ